MQGLHFLGQNVVAGLLAEEHKQFADGAVEQLPLFEMNHSLWFGCTGWQHLLGRGFSRGAR